MNELTALFGLIIVDVVFVWGLLEGRRLLKEDEKKRARGEESYVYEIGET